MREQHVAQSTEPTGGMFFGRRMTLFTLLGFRVQLDMSWLFLALLVTWSLAKGFFPIEAPGLPAATYWWMGIAGTIGLLFSLVLHELSHSLVARRYGMTIRGITLFIFGGVAELADEPPSAKAELWTALAGPAMSLLIAVLFAAIAGLGSESGWPPPAVGVAAYLGTINFVLAAFNLVPAYPLDGGRVLRAALWRWKGDLHWATRQASRVGGGFAFLLMAAGALQLINGNFIVGVWWFLIGLFLRNASTSSYTQLLAREMLAGKPVSAFMTPNPITVPSTLALDELVEDYIYRNHHERFPVVDGSTLIGAVGARQIASVPRADWPHRTVADIVVRASSLNTVEADADASHALALMGSTRNSRLLVLRQGTLVDILTLKDLLKLLALRARLEEGR
jgi:Zn-dependent protease/CBS domain-containing protein